MKWQIARLLKESTKEIEIDEEVDFFDAIKKNPDIKAMTPVRVLGKGFVFTTQRTMKFDLTIKGEMTLSCALTLDDVIYPFHVELHPTFTWDENQYEEDSEDYYARDTIELAPIVWQEIFIQIPLRVVKDGAYEELARQGIKIPTAEEIEEEDQKQIDPRLAVLEGLKFEN